MNEPTPPIAGQAAHLTTSRVNDADQSTLICVVHLDVKPSYAECCAVTRAGVSRPIGRSPAGYRIDSASAECFADGTVRLWLSCWPEDQSGTQAAVRYIDFPNAFTILSPAAIDQPARNQANAATNMAAYAITQNAAQSQQIVAIDGRLSALEGI